MPPVVPADQVILAAAKHVHAGRRLELGGLARELSISRVTLHRRVGNREQLLGETLWLLAERTFAMGVRRWEQGVAADRIPAGTIRSLWIMAFFRRAVADDPGLGHLLQEEPALAIRLLTDPRGRVQPRVIGLQVGLLQTDVDAGVLDPPVELNTLSYAVVRLGESFLYADVLASRRPDLDACGTLIDALVLATPVVTSR